MVSQSQCRFNTAAMEPVSRTYQYRKVMKPLLERKRRARINKCLDELKDLLSGALPTDSDNVSKLEKADILELTVRHLYHLRSQKAIQMRPENVNVEHFWKGFRLCTKDVSQFLTKVNNIDILELFRYIPGFDGCILNNSNRLRDIIEPEDQLYSEVWRPW